jgi:NADH dehydrogenase
VHVAVFGSTGSLGKRVVDALVAAGDTVRAVSRDPSARTRWPSSRVENAAADLRDPASLARACTGVTHVVTTANGFVGRGPNASVLVDGAGNLALIAAARDAKVEHFVFVSAKLAAPDSPIDSFRFKFEAEQALAASGMSHTIVRPTSMIESWLERADAALHGGQPFPIVGHGDRPINFIASDDAARYIALAVRAPRVRNKFLTIGGPEDISLNDLADRISTACGEKLRARHVPISVARVVAATAGRFNAILRREIILGALLELTDQRFDVRPVERELGVAMTPVDDVIASWAKSRGMKPRLDISADEPLA